jgi:hypothetical protein
MPIKETKYRPYLSLSELERIIRALDPETDKDIIKPLQLIVIKATGGFIEGSYVSNPRPTMEEKLGLTEDDEAAAMQKLLQLQQEK